MRKRNNLFDDEELCPRIDRKGHLRTTKELLQLTGQDWYIKEDDDLYVKKYGDKIIGYSRKSFFKRGKI